MTPLTPLPLLPYALGACSLGVVLVAGDVHGLEAVLLGDDADALRRDLAERFPDARPVEDPPALGDLLVRVVAQIDGPTAPGDLPLAPRGTPFQRQVWTALGTIPAGEVRTYAGLAAAIGAPASAARAVAAACAANPLAVVVPCHRVVRGDGSLSGYRWGVDRKRLLLDREAGRR